jgi:transposase
MPVMVAAPLVLADADHSMMERMARSTSLPHRVVVQTRALLWAADGVANEEIARRCGVQADTVRAWRRRFELRGVEGIGTVAKGRGRKSWLPEGTVAEVVRLTLEETPEDTSTHWTTRTLAERVGIGKDSVARIWKDHHLKPWKTDTFKISHDPRFEEKLVDVVGLYMDPPQRAAVFSFDEKTQCQALDRTQPSLPMRPGRAQTMTHDYKRHGTTDLFAAMNVATGEVLYDTRKTHTGKDVLTFFKLLDLHVPRDLEVHVILDNLSAHMGPEVTRWLDHPKRSRWHLHFTPTSSSWTNLVERWFKELTERRLRRGVFTSVGALIDAIETWTEHWNDNPTPFVWHTPAQEIIEKVRRGRASLHQIKSATDH